MRHSKPYRRSSGLKPLLILLLVLIVGVTGTVFTYMFKRTEFKENSLIPAKVSCALNEAFDADTGVKSNITVKNTGNIDAYIPVRLVTYWEKEGKIAAKTYPENIIENLKKEHTVYVIDANEEAKKLGNS